MTRSMKIWMVQILWACALAVFPSAGLLADPPPLVRYQAVLTDAAGVPLTGPHDLLFSIFSQQSGGILLWSEPRPGYDVGTGTLDVLLGEGVPLTSNLLGNTDGWLEVSIDGAVLGPRQRLASVPFSLVTHRLGTKTLTELESGTDAKIAAHAAAPDPHPAYVSQTGDTMTGTLTVSPSSGNALVTGAGNVGIGVPSPTQKLSVAGTIESTSGGFRFPDATTQSTAVPPLGRTPISGVTTITTSGHYYLAQNISIAAGTAITISASNVVLDLNGHLVSSSAATGSLIQLSLGFTDIWIRNGALSGGQVGVSEAVSAGSLPGRFAAHGLRITNSAFGLDFNKASYAEVISCVLHSIGSVGINVSNGTAPMRGRFLDNTVEDAGIFGMSVNCLTDGEIRRNIISGHGGSIASGVAIQLNTAGCPQVGGNIIENNTVRLGGGDDYGIYVLGGSHNNLISNNVVTFGNLNAFRILSSGNRIAENILNGAAGDGLYVTGNRNLIEGNQIEGNTGLGINFGGGASHAYRNNMLRGNTAGTVGGIGTRTDAGGNIL